MAPPSGGRYRQVIVDLNPDAMYAKGVSATDVSTADIAAGVADTPAMDVNLVACLAVGGVVLAAWWLSD